MNADPVAVLFGNVSHDLVSFVLSDEHSDLEKEHDLVPVHVPVEIGRDDLKLSECEWKSVDVERVLERSIGQFALYSVHYLDILTRSHPVEEQNVSNVFNEARHDSCFLLGRINIYVVHV